MYSRFLFVGLGGSGGKTLRFLKREIYHWLEHHDAGTSIPSGWQFLHIDTPATADGDEIDHLADPLPADEYLGLIGPGLTFAAVQNKLDGNEHLRSELQTWRVDPAGLAVGIQMGAGQFRAIGQTVSMAYTSQIRTKLQQAISRISSAKGPAETGQVFSKVTGETPDVTSPMYIVVISSLAGGTGAGLLNTVCDVLRAEKTDAADNIFGVLYTPEVFSALGDASTGGVQPNSLAALSEILNGHWWGGSPILTASNLVPPIVNPALTAAGLPNAIERSGPSFPFLVGRVGTGGVDHGTPERLFEMAGRSLLSWVTDQTVQAKFIAYTAGNWANTAMNHTMGPILVNEGETQDQGYPCFSALGFARVSVGTEYFENYAVQRIVKYANEVLVDYHYRSEEAQHQANTHATNDPDEIADAVARNHLRHFVNQAHLSELGPDDNQIFDRLRPQSSQTLYDDFKKRSKELSGLGDGSKLSAQEWRKRIHAGIEQAANGYEKNYQSALEDSTLEWITDIQNDVVQAVETAVARLGLKVTAALCALTASELRNDTHNDLLNNDYEKNNAWASNWKSYADQQLEGITGNLDSDHAGLDESVSTGMNSASYAGEALVAGRAAELCTHIADRLIAPLELALLTAHSQAKDEQAKTATWVSWTDAEPPDSVTPPAGDFPLLDPPEYAEQFSKYLALSTNQKQSVAAQQHVLHSVVSGDFLRDEGTTQAKRDFCVQVDHDWWPATTAALGGFKAPADLVVRVETGLSVLESRTRQWLHRTGSPFATFLNLSLRSYLGTTATFDDSNLDAAAVKQNQNRFLSMMSAAMNAAEPLINLDATLMGIVHPNSTQQPNMHFSQIPFQGHPIETDVVANLITAGIHEATVPDLLTNDDSIRHIDITTALHAPHSLLVIKSLLTPISQTWHKMVADGVKQSFWTRRRAQRLQRFIPASQALIICMIRGWFTGKLLGRIDSDSNPVQIARAGHPVAEFPYPFLSADSGPEDRMALVLESLGLAYVEVSRLSNLEPLAAYIELRELGRSGPESGLYEYSKLNQALASWVQTGSLAEQIASPFAQLTNASNETGDDADGAAHRINNLIQVLDQAAKSYEDLYQANAAEWSFSPTSLSGPPHWTGLAPLISQGLAGMATAARSYRSNMGEGGALLG